MAHSNTCDKRGNSTSASFFLLFFLLHAASAAEAPGSPGVRAIPLAPPAMGHAGFTLQPSAITGIDFTNTLSAENASQNQIRLNGSGIALGDVDGDGLCDIFACSLEGRWALYRNLGNWRFTNAAASAGLDLQGHYSTGATLADVDSDGDLDLLVNGIGTGTRLFHNDGRGHFIENKATGLLSRFGAMTSTLADIDGDGDLDLYVANYRTTTVRTTGFALLNVDGRRMIQPQDRGRLELTPEGRVLEHGEPHILYRNDGHGKFTPVSWTGGAFLDEEGRPLSQPPLDWGLTAAFRDLNNDGFPDLHVCSDFHSPDRIWINDGHGRFRAIPRLAIRHTATFSMSADFADVDRDGRDDILVSDMTSRHHGRRLMQIAGMDPYAVGIGLFQDRPQLDRSVLQWNRGDGTYAEIAHYAGLENSEWNWSVVFLDVDLDGFEDVLATTGHLFDTQDLDAQAAIQAAGPYPREKIPRKLLKLPPLDEPKLAFRNRGNLTFAECGSDWGFNQTGVSHGIALADLDNDGDLDVVVNNLNGPLGIYRNETAAPRIAIRLNGLPANTRGIGSRITVTGGPVIQTQEMMCGGRYLSSDDTMRVFAAYSPTNRLRIEITWRSGKQSIVPDALPNYRYEIDESQASAPRPHSGNPEPPVVFEDATALLAHTHGEEHVDDFARQPLLPKRLSQLGPGACWWDMDGDGWEDLILGAGKGSQAACYLNDGKGGFRKNAQTPWNMSAMRDVTAILGWRAGEVLAGAASYEDGEVSGASVNIYRMGRPQPEEFLAGWECSAGPMALADYDGDGWLDLFVGGRAQPGRYPLPASSRLCMQKEGKLQLDASNSALLKDAGLVSGAVWADLDGDGWPDLILACEWGPIKVFHNNKGAFKEITQELGLDKFLGWWNGVAAGDFDGDGLMDIAASNWGRNTKYRASPESPLSLYYGDFNEDGVLDIIEASVDPATGRDVPDRDLDSLSAGLGFVREKYPTHAAYGKASVSDLLGDRFQSAGKVAANTLDSMLFLNRGRHFQAVSLPAEAQFSTAFALCVGDFDGDGNEDLFLSQNFYATEPKTPRCDAGRGLWLRGNGKGGLRPVSGQESGILAYGEQRGAALCDYDHDGRADLIVTQNGAQTRLFHNVNAKPGLRIRLEGNPGNPGGIGAVIRLQFGPRMGPARQIHAGSGYWSQDALTQVIGCAEPPTKVHVLWPGGRRQTEDVPAGAKEMVVRLKRS